MRRRTPGLRREEVAILAGVSADYYIRLEQGRDHHPSSQVLDALGRPAARRRRDRASALAGQPRALAAPARADPSGARTAGHPAAARHLDRHPGLCLRTLHNELIGQLSVSSEPFRHLWARHDVRPKRSGVTHREHPQIGPIDLNYEKLPTPDADRMTLCIYHANPGSPSAQALSLLATLVHTALTAPPTRSPSTSSTAPWTNSPLSRPA